MAEKSEYAGRIKNTGAQFVEAPYKVEKKRTGSVKKGKEQKTGKSGK